MAYSNMSILNVTLGLEISVTLYVNPARLPFCIFLIFIFLIQREWLILWGKKKSHKHSVDFSIQIHQDNLHSGSEAIFELKAVCEKGKNTVLSHGKKSFKLVAVTGQKLCVFFREMPGAVFEFLQQGGVHCFTALTDYWFAAASQEPSLTTCDSWWQMLDR